MKNLNLTLIKKNLSLGSEMSGNNTSVEFVGEPGPSNPQQLNNLGRIKELTSELALSQQTVISPPLDPNKTVDQSELERYANHVVSIL